MFQCFFQSLILNQKLLIYKLMRNSCIAGLRPFHGRTGFSSSFLETSSQATFSQRAENLIFSPTLSHIVTLSVHHRLLEFSSKASDDHTRNNFMIILIMLLLCLTLPSLCVLEWTHKLITYIWILVPSSALKWTWTEIASNKRLKE